VAFNVLDEMVAAHERPGALRTHKLLFTGVRALVARQLVAARKELVAAVEGALEGLLASVDAVVCLEVRQLVVPLVATEKIAGERLFACVSGGVWR